MRIVPAPLFGYNMDTEKLNVGLFVTFLGSTLKLNSSSIPLACG